MSRASERSLSTSDESLHNFLFEAGFGSWVSAKKYYKALDEELN